MNKNLKILILLTLLISLFAGLNYSNIVRATSIDKDKVVDYDIYSISEDNIGNAKRYSYKVIINEKAEVEELKETSKRIIQIAKQKKEFNGFNIFLYDYKEYADGIFTLGRVRYVPDGDWGKAGEVQPGDYEKLDYSWILLEKNWDKQLTPKEVEIWKRYDDLLWSTELSEEKIAQQVAEKFNITAKKVDDIYMKKSLWVNMDLKE